MAEIRLSKLIKQFGIGLGTLIEFLESKNIEVENNPNAKVSDEIIPELEAKFGADLKAKLEADKAAAKFKITQEANEAKKAKEEEEFFERPDIIIRSNHKTVINEEDKKYSILFNSQLSQPTSNIAPRYKNNILFLLNPLCEESIVSQDGFYAFLDVVIRAFKKMSSDWKNIILSQIVKAVSSKIDKLAESEVELSPIFGPKFIDFFLTNCLTQEYRQSLTEESGGQFFSVLDKLFDLFVRGKDFEKVSRVLCSCANSIPENWCIKIINTLNALLIDETEKIVGYIEDLCCYDYANELSCFELINQSCHRTDFYFFKELFLAISVVKKDISIIQDTPYFEKDILKRLLCSLSHEELLALAPYLRQDDYIFNSLFLDLILGKLSVDDIFTISEQLNGDSLFGILLDLTEAQDIILSILSKDDETALLSTKYYHRFSDVVKNKYISLFNAKKHNAKLLLNPYEGISIADVLSKDQYYIDRPTLRIRSEMLVDGYVADYLELKNKGVIDEISNTCIKSAINKVDNPQGQYFILNQFGLKEDEILYFLVKEIPGSSLTEQVLSVRVNNTINDILNYINKHYVVFDIEGDKDEGIGWEFAYMQNGSSVRYKKALDGQRLLNTTQWKELEDAITSSQIIVGHNIKRWDYPLLKKRNKSFGKDSRYLKNTWDTLEIELLLNPLRPSFALNAENGHKADNDVTATEILFRQQLYAILEAKESYELVKPYLPSIIVSQIDKRAKIIYSSSTFSMHDEDKHNELFYKPAYQDIPELKQSISGNLLIVAEEDIWQTVFNKFSARFYSDSTLDEYNALNLEKISEKYSNPKNIYERALLAIAQNCKRNKKSLNIKSIPKIIRYKISDKVLRKYVLPEAEPNVICIKPEIVDVVVCDMNFDNVLILCDSLIPRCSFIKNCNEQIIDIIEEQSEYSIYTQAFPVNVESLVKLGIKANPYREYWIAQPVPKEFVVLSRLTEQSIISTLKKKYPTAKFLGKDNNSIVENFVDVNPSFEEDDNEYKFLPGKYWASRLEAFNKYETNKPKILIVDTCEEAKSASKYLKIPYARKSDIRKKLDKATEKIGYNVITVLQDLLDCDVYDLGASFCFILNDTAILSKQGKGYHFDKAKEQLENRLSLFGNESQILFLDDLVRPNAISEDQIIKAEKCLGKEDTIALKKEDLNPLLDWIKNKYNITAFRGLQEPAIKKVVEYKGSQRNFLTILPTGGGKSVIFQGPILYKAIEKGSKKLSIVITPLQALMEDQVQDIIDKGFDSSLIACINANTPSEERRRIIKNIRKHKVSLLYIAPERLMMRNFFQNIIRTAAEDQGIDSIIFDEAHCITAWGMDFRSDYILALRKCLELQKVHKGITIQMFTATLPWQSKEDLKAEIQFGKNDCNILPSPDSDEYKKSLCPIRDHIELQIIKTEAKKEEANSEKLKSILNDLDENTIDNLTSGRSRMIIFTYSRNDAEESAEWLKEKIQNEDLREKISFFHARIERHEKERRIRQFKDGQILILCSTKAFGLGMNIPNVHYLFHLTPPTFIEDYLQEVGRAARKTDKDEYAPYMEAFPIVNGKREPVKAICYYTQSDIGNRLERIQRIYWEEIHDTFEDIKKYVSNFRNSNGRYIIPIDLLASKERTDFKNKSKNDDLIGKFEQCLGWLSQQNGLNRIQLGFRCPDSYDLGYNSNASGISESSQLNALIEYLKATLVIQENYSRIIIQANSIIGNSSLGIDSIEDLESIIDEGVRLGVFNRDYMHISISLKNKKYLMDFIEKPTNELDVLSILCESLKDRHIDNFNLAHNLDEKLDNISKEKQISDKKREYIKSVLTESWKFFVDLNKIYTVDEIEANCKNLIREIGQSKAESVSWTTMEKAIDAQADTNKLKLFLYATSKLSYTTKGSANTDFIEISIPNDAELDENTDSKAKEAINNFYLNKQSRAGAMCGLLEEFKDSENTKKFIREYSACPTDKIDELDIVARDKSRVSARKGLEDAVETELNDEQQVVYNLPANQNINVIAGAGSGKTRLLIYRALKLILDEGNNESRVLILAYNRAVRDEVEKRMAEYASNIHCPLDEMKIYTFHGYASISIPNLQNNKVNFDEWERSLLQDIIDNHEKYENKYRHILIDEFQDVTTTRLEIIKSLLKLNAPCNAFVIGDMFQSIYGYEKKKDDRQSSIEPLDYYSQLKGNGAFEFSVKNLTYNHRSYQAIIDTAQIWFEGMTPKYTKKYKGLVPDLKSKLEKDKYVQIDDNDKGKIPCMTGNDWKGDFFEKIFTPFINNRYDWSKNNNGQNPFSSIGILFRTNSDVQDAFQWLKKQEFIKDNNIEVRIQGSDIFYSSTREFYFFERELKKLKGKNATENIVKEIYKKLNICEYAYDNVVLDVAQELALYILNRNTHNNLSCKELAEEFNFFARTERNHLKETLDRKQDNSQTTNNLRIIVSTIHRVKGLEFDAVVIPASKCPIGFGNDGLSPEEVNMEERRLMYVAFSRAKRMLFYYMGERENAILTNNYEYAGQEGLIYADDGQSKVYQAVMANADRDNDNQYISKYVKIGDEIIIRKGVILPKNSKDQKEHIIGILSQNNELRSKFNNQPAGFTLTGFRVKSVNVITKEQDDFYTEQKRVENPKYPGVKWCDNAINRGYVYYIDYYGCINLNKGNGEQN